jgi:hypothetical protein
MVGPRLTVALVALLLAASAAWAQLPFDPAPQKDPYRDLFGRSDPQNTTPRAPLIVREAPQKPYVVCGTLIVPADASIDPKMRIVPPDSGVKHTMRTISPPICRR